MKIDQASKLQNSKSSGAVIPKGSMFGVKFGFVIPKNKLSGALVPAFRRASKTENISSANGEKKEHAARKTKWGPDLTQDAFVRKARLSAYQTRLNQITQQMEKNGTGTEVGQDADMDSLNNNKESALCEIDTEELDNLKLERREIIGEILKLNPSYKAPADYVPLLKEERVPLPIEDYPGYNFLGLIYGSGSDTLKRLEKETGAKIQVFGTKRDSVEKVEITSDSKNNQDDYMELYTLISADAYEKVDAAVALVELLVTPVFASNSTPSNATILGQSSETSSGNPNAAVAGLVQPVIRPTQVFQDQFQYNVNVAAQNNQSQLLSSQTTPGDMVHVNTTGPHISEQSPLPLEPRPHMQAYVPDSNNFRPFDPPRHTSVAASQIFLSQPNPSNLHPFGVSQVTSLGLASMVRPSPTDHLIRSELIQVTGSPRWPLLSGPANSNMAGITSAPVQGHQNTAFGMAPPPPFNSRPSTLILPSNMNQGAATITSVTHPQVKFYHPSQSPSAATIPTHSVTNFDMQMQPIRGRATAAPENPAYLPGVLPFPGPSVSMLPLNQPYFPPVRSVTGMVPRMQFPISDDFVFQPHQPQNSDVLMNPRPAPYPQNYSTLEPTIQKVSDIRVPFNIPDYPHQPHRPFFRGNLGPQADDRYDRVHHRFTERNPSDVFLRPFFPHDYGVHDATFSHRGDMSINRPHQMGHMHGSFLSRTVNDFFPNDRPGINSLNIHPSSRQNFRPSRGQQAYDPFSPSTASAANQQQEVSNNIKLNDQEMSNPEN